MLVDELQRKRMDMSHLVDENERLRSKLRRIQIEMSHEMHRAREAEDAVAMHEIARDSFLADIAQLKGENVELRKISDKRGAVDDAGNSTLLVASIQRKRGGRTTREVTVTVRFDGRSEEEDNDMCPHLGMQDEDDDDTEKITMLESCCFSGLLTINHSILSCATEIFDNLFGNPFRTPWSKGNGIVISADSCFGNPLRINIKRPSYLRQSYGLDINNARPFNRDAFRACYGTGGGLRTLGIPKW